MAALICCLTAPATTEIYTLSLHDALPILIERPALAKRERIRRRWEILVLGQGREPQHLGALGVELHLPRRRVEREARIRHVRDPQRAHPALGGQRGHRGVARRRMVEDRVDGAVL